jgi:hypothetical protein
MNYTYFLFATDFFHPKGNLIKNDDRRTKANFLPSFPIPDCEENTKINIIVTVRSYERGERKEIMD